MAQDTRDLKACELPGERTPLIITLGQSDQLTHGGRRIEVVPAWKWLD